VEEKEDKDCYFIKLDVKEPYSSITTLVPADGKINNKL
jgi:hypothetical protein